MFSQLANSWQELLMHPTTFYTILAFLLFFAFFFIFRRVQFSLHTLLTCSLMIALTIILHNLKLYHFPQGGSVTCGSLVPLILISYRYGFSAGCFAGFIYSLVNLLQDPFIVHPLQVLFDYPFPSMCLALAAFFPAHRLSAAALGLSGKFICHLISGIVFFADYAPAGTSPFMYSLTVNLTYMLPEAVICLLILRLLPVNKLIKAMR